MARTGLGRGLDVLLGGPSSSPTANPVVASTEIPLEKVIPNPQQPRTYFDNDGIQELAASIRRHGVLQPIVVSRSGDGFELVAGQRRVLASRAAGKTTIPAVIRDDVRDRLELALVENLQRADLNAIETARAYKLLMDTYGLNQEQVAERVGKSRSHVANMLRALSAPQVLQDAVVEGRISEGHLRALLPLPLSAAVAALGDVIARELSVRDTEILAKRFAGAPRHKPHARIRNGDPNLAAVTNELRAALGTKVEIARRRRGGQIRIEFYSDEDFERLYELFVRAGKA